MPSFVQLPRSGDGVLDRRQILNALGSLLLSIDLLCMEVNGRQSGTTFLNKLLAADPHQEPGNQDLQVLLAGHGGEGESLAILMRCAAISLPAGRGGEEKSTSSPSLLAPGKGSKGSRQRGLENCISLFFFSLSGRGGMGRREDGVLALSSRCCFCLRGATTTS
jgi:hypothetical protein